MEPSTTHRLCAFQNSENGLKHEIVPHFVADEVETLRAFVTFLYPQKGQDRFQLLRPDIHCMEWVVYDRSNRATYSSASTPTLAVERAVARQKEELHPTKL